MGSSVVISFLHCLEMCTHGHKAVWVDRLRLQLEVRRIERSCRPIDSWAEEATLSTRVLRYSSMLIRARRPSHFALLRMFLTIWTYFSARPLDCGFDL